MPVFYGTTRARTGSKPVTYSNEERAKIDLGLAWVSIPPNHVRGRLEERSVLKFWAKPDPLTEVVLAQVVPLNTENFNKRLSGTVENSKSKRLLIFVHGFNNTFSQAARRAGQLAYDLDMRATPVLYSWPSRGSALAYVSDKGLSGHEGSSLANFIAHVVVESKARSFTLIAHSMGNHIFSAALETLPAAFKERGYKLDDGKLPFEDIIMAAPDVEQQRFKDTVSPKLSQSGARVTVYHSYADLTMYMSAFFNQRAPLGHAGVGLPGLGWLDSVNATRQSIEGLGLYHSYFASLPVIRDLRQLFSGKRAAAREYLCRVCVGKDETWRLVRQQNCPVVVAGCR